ncbi:UNKNOWN [Stylonychia lemnae]|uniref:USP domain-containing protein n=1 Tax=Stylonychia lemnae TaxID=5949 RepID=A0A078ALD9_STYLE|nr:UNKNOWN [Stylonychia lemnae]|eukprot:CDW82691.1 UNKNOWN [Stylonychia lemnae]
MSTSKCKNCNKYICSCSKLSSKQIKLIGSPSKPPKGGLMKAQPVKAIQQLIPEQFEIHQSNKNQRIDNVKNDQTPIYSNVPRYIQSQQNGRASSQAPRQQLLNSFKSDQKILKGKQKDEDIDDIYIAPFSQSINTKQRKQSINQNQIQVTKITPQSFQHYSPPVRGREDMQNYRGMNLNNFKEEKQENIQFFGLENPPGHNNCYLNSVLQSIWNLTKNSGLPKYLLSEETFGSIDERDEPIIQDFINSFKENSLQKIQVFNPVAVRTELFKLFYEDQKFDLTDKADASEAFYNILCLIHSSNTPSQGQSKQDKNKLDFDDKCEIQDCFIHQCFQINTLMTRICQCGELVIKQKSDVNSFIQIQDEIEFCLNQNCKLKRTETKVYINKPCPRVLSMNLNWNQEEAKPEDIMKILVSFPDYFDIRELFEEQVTTYTNLPDDNLSLSKNTYRSYNDLGWIMFNDEQVRKVQKWENVIDECSLLRMKPTLIFYQQFNRDTIFGNSRSREDIKIEKFELKYLERKILSYQREIDSFDDVDKDVYIQQKLLLQSFKKEKTTHSKSEEKQVTEDFKKDKLEMKLKINEENEQRLNTQQQLFKNLKLKYHKEGVYLYNCLNYKCNFKLMLHQEYCYKCCQQNTLRDFTVQVSPQVEKDVIDQLLRIFDDEFKISNFDIKSNDNEDSKSQTNIEEVYNEEENSDEDENMKIDQIDNLELENEDQDSNVKKSSGIQSEENSNQEQNVNKMTEIEWQCEYCEQLNIIIYEDISSSYCQTLILANLIQTKTEAISIDKIIQLPILINPLFLKE